MIEIPEAKRDGPLTLRLLPTVLSGFDQVMDRESQLYLRQLCRLIDKSFSEYSLVRQLLIEEIKSGDRLQYRFEVINHLESCVSAVSGVGKIIFRLIKGDGPVRKNLDIYKLISKEMKQKVSKDKIWKIRNMVEHIDKEIYIGNIKDQLFLDVTSDYKSISINRIGITLVNLVDVIATYHQLVVEVFDRLPVCEESGKYHYK